MKKILICLSILAITACEKDTMDKISQVKNQVKNTSSVIGNLTDIEKNAKEIERQMEELKQQQPFTNDEFKAWMPQEIDGMARTNFQFQSVMGSQGSLTFADESGEKKFEIDIMDGAGEQGAAMFASQGFLTGLYGNFESENDSKKEEIIEKNGVKSMVTYYKNDHRSAVRTVIDNRFIVNAKGEDMTPEELFELIEKLNIQKLNA